MNRKLNTLVGLVLVFALVAQIGMTVDSFPGFHSGSDCSYCHNEPASSVNADMNTAKLTLDGDAKEEFWDHTYGRRAYVPVVFRDQVTRDTSEIMFVQTTFAQNTTHLFMLLEWDTQGTSNADDGVAVLWNINATEPNPNYDTGMKTQDGKADLWVLEATTASAGTNNSIVASEMNDWSMDDEGIIKSGDTDDVHAVLKHHVELVRGSPSTFYTAEFARKLTTAETTKDVQFDGNDFHTYSIAVFNESSGVEHLTSYTHEVYVQGNSAAADARYAFKTETETVDKTNEVNVTDTINETKEGTPIQIGFFVVSLISTVAIVAIVRRRNK
jgi:hypothetical protein